MAAAGDGEELLAVYGTLMSGAAFPGRPDVERVLEPRGTCRIPGTLHDLGRGYPGLKTGAGRDGEVRGELFAVRDPAVLAELDAYEDDEYERRRLRLAEPDVEAWVYVLAVDPPADSRIDDGDWRTWLALRGPR